MLLVLLLLTIAASNSEAERISWERPMLHPLTVDHHVIPVGEIFELRCAGDFPLEWVVPDSDKDASTSNDSLRIENRINLTHEVVQGEVNRKYVSHLKLVDLYYLDTGYYYCKYQGTSDLEVS